MKRKALTLTVTLVLLFAVVVGMPFANLASAQFSGTVNINADGTVDPADAPIQRDGDTYTLTGDVGGISVQRSNIILDGNGHTLPGEVTSFDEILGINVTAHNAGGVFLKSVENVIVKNLHIKNCQTGIYLEGCSNVTVSGNTITGTYVPVPQFQMTGGIYVWRGGLNVISGNNIVDNLVGIYIGYNFGHNVIVGNNITRSTIGGIRFWDSSNNTVYGNRFINNTWQADSADAFNIWDDGARGNYWSDYNCSDANWDSIGDTPYVIDANNQDNYPLLLLEAPQVTVFSSENGTYVGSFPLNFTVNKPTQWMGYSLDGEANVTVAGNTTLSGLETGLHNLTVYVIDVYGITGASATVTFTIEPEPFPTVLVIASVAGIAVGAVGLLVYFKKRKH
jgi:parallel beta-helix repeat protein